MHKQRWRASNSKAGRKDKAIEKGVKLPAKQKLEEGGQACKTVKAKGGMPSVLFGLEAFTDTVGSAKSGITTSHAQYTPKTNSEDSVNLNNLNALKNVVVLKSKTTDTS